MIDDQSNYLVNDVLAISDRMTMQASVEMRMPYLDQELSSFAQSLAPEFMLSKETKHLLKTELIRLGGEAYVKRAKEGFGLPFGGWVDKERGDLWRFVDAKDHIVFNFVGAQKIKDLIRVHQSGRSDHTLALWSILVLSHWLERHFA